MEESQLMKERLQAITEKHRIQEVIRQKKQELDQEKLKLKHLKKKSLREQWLLDSSSHNAPGSFSEQQTRSLLLTIYRMEKAIEALEREEAIVSKNESFILEQLRAVEKSTQDIIKEAHDTFVLDGASCVYPEDLHMLLGLQAYGDDERKCVYSLHSLEESDQSSVSELSASEVEQLLKSAITQPPSNRHRCCNHPPNQPHQPHSLYNVRRAHQEEEEEEEEICWRTPDHHHKRSCPDIQRGSSFKLPQSKSHRYTSHQLRRHQSFHSNRHINHPSNGFCSQSNPANGFSAPHNHANGFSTPNNLANGFSAPHNHANGFSTPNNLANGFCSQSNHANGFSAPHNHANGFSVANNHANSFCSQSNRANGFSTPHNHTNGFSAPHNHANGFSAANKHANSFCSQSNRANGFSAPHNHANGFSAPHNHANSFSHCPAPRSYEPEAASAHQLRYTPASDIPLGDYISVDEEEELVRYRSGRTSTAPSPIFTEDTPFTILSAMESGEPVTAVFMGFQPTQDDSGRDQDFEGVLKAELVVIDDDYGTEKAETKQEVVVDKRLKERHAGRRAGAGVRKLHCCVLS